MKNKNLFLTFLIVFLFTSFRSFCQPVPLDSIVWDNDGNPLYMRYQMIVKFNPLVVDSSVIDDTTFQKGVVSDFINPRILQTIIDSGYFDSTFANLYTQKIHRMMTTYDTISISRLGDTVRIPEFWSTFLIYYSSNIGLSFEDVLDSLNNMWPIVEYAHPNYIYIPDINESNDPLLMIDPITTLRHQRGIYNNIPAAAFTINVGPAWSLTTGDPSVKVGIYDSGIKWNHEDFSENGTLLWNKSRVKGGWDFVNGGHPLFNTNFDTDNHGTICAGLIGAIRNNSIGISGVAGGDFTNGQFGVSLYGFRVWQGTTWAKTNIIADAIREGATSFNGSYGYGLNIMNLSWHSLSYSQTLNDQIQYAFRNKVLVFCASGNRELISVTPTPIYGNTFAAWPAAERDEWVMVVGANKGTGEEAELSNFGNGIVVDFLAPGETEYNSSLTSANTSSYTTVVEGTSVSCPIAAGTGALMLSYFAQQPVPNQMAPEDIDELLKKSARTYPTPNTPTSAIGFGVIKAGPTLESIKWPEYEVRHYKQTFNNSEATFINTTTNFPFVIDKYKITKTFNITQPNGRTILDVWKRNSSSTLYGDPLDIGEVNSIVTSWNQNTAIMEGYIYRIYNMINHKYQFYPYANPITFLKFNGEMDLTVYSYDPNASNLTETSIIPNLLQLYPNPGNGDFTVAFSLLKKSNIKIEIQDVNGRTVYNKPEEFKEKGYIEYKIVTENLSPGIYICNIITNNSRISRKLIIMK